MSRKRIYNRVMQANDVCPLGELLTDKELERMKLYNCRRDWPFTMKVKVRAEDVYFSFGVRRIRCFGFTGEICCGGSFKRVYFKNL